MIDLGKYKQKQPERFLAQFNHYEEVLDWMIKVNGPHQLHIPNPKKINFIHEGIQIGETTFGTVKYSTLASITIDNLKYCYIFNVPIKGIQEIKFKSSTIYSNNEVAAIFSPNQPFSMILEPECEKKMIRISKKNMESHLIRMLGYKINQPLIFDIQAPMQGPIQKWFNLAINFQEFLLEYDSLLDFQSIWDNFENNLISILLNFQPHNYSLELERRLTGKPSYLNNIDGLLKENLSQPLKLNQLEKVLGISREQLYQDFHSYFGQSPVAYLRNLRFEETYKRLKNIKPWENVSSIAMDCGFQQLGRFSQEYKTRFGEFPSETLKKINNINKKRATY